ncbi:asparagine synthase (glutamine-hydrolyzing) [Chitinophagaceae bacterium LB-8]|uniref:asparagine synthase (glutamine-hydrolyzing) n=1 Tax=Paraflavisolibacter caeni TaxID=2982496 RepID=A0A9X3BJK1_9BACT|nr:asparagine synthase (glutamine-hydrolyzing) [Paraflavisolibacter caeni]MCU7551303.1 asparagine synthase (glutamine-hydrolyzing) [Paraflavisolibacter caeni]
MCGIAGFIDFRKSSSEELLQKMTTTLYHRGPDGEGIYFIEASQAQIGLGHRRLSIIDLSECGSQPMHFNGLHIAFNGEVYNFEEIRKELEKKGHQFHGHSDTEVIIHAYHEWGVDAIQQWKGMFAVVIYDEAKDEIIAIRDRAGVKPFYYYWQDGLFLFASELKAIVAHPGFKRELDPAAVASYLQYGYVSFPHCIYKHTNKLSAAHVLQLDLKKQVISTVKYWNVYDYYNRPKVDMSFGEAILETEKVLQKAFNYRMVADVPVGVFLSGGFDSSCVTALLQKDSTEKIKTFTIGTTDKELDEAPFAKQIAERLGTDHTEYYCTYKEALDIIPELPFYYDEPFADSSAIPTILVSRMARRKVTVALSADAGDEIFAGYNRYDYLIKYGKQLQSIPKVVRRAMAGVMENVSSESIPYFKNQNNFHSRYQKIRNLLNDPSPSEMLKNLSQVFTNEEISLLFLQPVKELPTALVSKELNPEFYDPLSYMMAVDYQTYMADDILQKVDRATMSASLEGREPFLDQSVIEWAAQLPNEFKYHGGDKKYIIKQIVYQYIPKDIMDRKKMGFAIPVQKWLNEELKDLVQEYLSERALSKHGMFSNAYVQKMVSSFFEGRTDLYLKIWYLLMFQMWFERWMK